MTTDRTAPPARSIVPPPAAGQASAPPADAFSALLGAVAPRTEAAPERHDDAPRADRPAHDDVPGHDTEEPATAPVADAPATEETPVATPVAPNLFALQLAGPLPPAAPPAPVAAAQPAVTTAPAPALPAFAPAQLPVTATVPATGEPVAALPQPATTPAPALPVLGGLIPASALATEPAAVVIEQPAVPALPQAPAAPDAIPDAPTLALPNMNAGQPQSDAQPQEQPNTAAPVATAAPQAKPAEAPAATAPAPQPVAAPAAPAAPATPAPAPALERAVPLYRAVETTRTLLHVAAERGVTHARLNLKPAELGGIEVRLQSTPQGVAAQLVADSPEAARMLSQAGDDLRRQLAERDVTLLSLDVSTSSEQRHDNTAGGFSGFGDDSYRPDRSAQGHGTPTDAAPASPAETTLVLPDGVLVDVLA